LQNSALRTKLKLVNLLKNLQMRRKRSKNTKENTMKKRDKWKKKFARWKSNKPSLNRKDSRCLKNSHNLFRCYKS
jgi:transketolase